MSEDVILVGVDGATYDLMDEWVENGDLPQLATLAQEGISHTFESVVPTQSIPAWPSCNSGKNPAKHPYTPKGGAGDIDERDDVADRLEDLGYL